MSSESVQRAKAPFLIRIGISGYTPILRSLVVPEGVNVADPATPVVVFVIAGSTAPAAVMVVAVVVMAELRGFAHDREA